MIGCLLITLCSCCFVHVYRNLPLPVLSIDDTASLFSIKTEKSYLSVGERSTFLDKKAKFEKVVFVVVVLRNKTYVLVF